MVVMLVSLEGVALSMGEMTIAKTGDRITSARKLRVIQAIKNSNDIGRRDAIECFEIRPDRED